MPPAQQAAERRGEDAAVGDDDHPAHVAGRERLERRAAAGRQLSPRLAPRDRVVGVARPPAGHLLRKPRLQVGPQVALEDAGVQFGKLVADPQLEPQRRGDRRGRGPRSLQRARPQFLDLGGDPARPGGHRRGLLHAQRRERHVLAALHAARGVGNTLPVTDEILAHAVSVRDWPAAVPPRRSGPRGRGDRGRPARPRDGRSRGDRRTRGWRP